MGTVTYIHGPDRKAAEESAVQRAFEALKVVRDPSTHGPIAQRALLAAYAELESYLAERCKA